MKKVIIYATDNKGKGWYVGKYTGGSFVTSDNRLDAKHYSLSDADYIKQLFPEFNYSLFEIEQTTDNVLANEKENKEEAK